MSELDSPNRIEELRNVLKRKYALRTWYKDSYEKFKLEVQNLDLTGDVIELGSGGGFIKDVFSDVITTDIIEYSGIDKVLDACNMSVESKSVKAIFLLNVLHHIPDANKFFAEVDRVLVQGGLVFITDQYPGIISQPILKYFHHEGFDKQAKNWPFVSTGPLSSANGALPWMIFYRDRKKFELNYPGLKITKMSNHSPLIYWLSGGLKKWQIANQANYQLFRKVDKNLIGLSRHFGSFFDVVVKKV